MRIWSIELGRVKPGGVGSWFDGIMGLAPLLIGSLAVFLIFRYGLAIQPPLPYAEAVCFSDTIYDISDGFFEKPLLIYLLFVCGNLALPSRSDYRYVPQTLIWLVVLGLAVYLTGSHIVPAWSDPEWWLQGPNLLSWAFSLVLLLNVVLLIPLQVLAGLFS